MKNTNKSIFENYPDVVTVEQLASMLGISTKTAYKKSRLNLFVSDVSIKYQKFMFWNICRYLSNFILGML